MSEKRRLQSTRAPSLSLVLPNLTYGLSVYGASDIRSVPSRSSRASRRSSRSQTSWSSKAPSVIDIKRADAPAELAAREAKFNVLQEEPKHKKATVRIESELK